MFIGAGAGRSRAFIGGARAEFFFPGAGTGAKKKISGAGAE